MFCDPWSLWRWMETLRNRMFLIMNFFFETQLHISLVETCNINQFSSVSSVAQLCPTLCDPMDCSTPGLPIHHQLPEFTQNSCPSSRWCHPTISSSVIPFSSRLQSFPASGSFPMSQFFVPGGPSIGVSASTSVLPMNIQDRFPLGWTGWISLQFKETQNDPQICFRERQLPLSPHVAL